MRTAARETAFQIALRNCSKEARGKGQYRCDFGEGELHAIRHTFFVECFCWSCECFCWSITQLYLTLCDPMNCSLPVSSVMGFSRQECCSVLSFPPPGVVLNPRIESTSLVSPALAGRFFTTEPPGNPQLFLIEFI